MRSMFWSEEGAMYVVVIAGDTIVPGWSVAQLFFAAGQPT